MKQDIVGLSFKERLIVVGKCLWACVLMFYVVTPKEYTHVSVIFRNLATNLLPALAPNQQAVRDVVNKMPFQPFGTPNVTYDQDLFREIQK